MHSQNVELKNAIHTHLAVMSYRDMAYINMMQQINAKAAAVLKDDLGSQFVQNCGRDLAGEVVRNFFDTSDYNITVDQLATRILKFSYDNEYDPLQQKGGRESIAKNVYNYGEVSSSTLDRITEDIDSNREKLFHKENGRNSYDNQGFIDGRKREYRENQRAQSSDHQGYDEYTGNRENYRERSDGVLQSKLDVDHVQDLDGASYSSKYVSESGRERLVDFYNSADNFAMMLDSANRSKNAIKVYDKNGNDITHRATPEQMAAAVCQKWENAENKQALIDGGYLNQDGTVPKSVRDKLIKNVGHSQNKESVIILQNIKYGQTAKSAVKHTAASVGKTIAGQVIYYTAPPLVYEVRQLLKEKIHLEDVFPRLKNAMVRMVNYVCSKLKDIFENVIFNSLKKFVKSFMDILIELVKATVKKLLKIAKNLALATVDAVRIIADKNASPSEKADSVFNLFGVTITSCILEVLFELVEKSFGIPEFLLAPLQILATVVCTNLTMLILQKADLFDVRFGFKINAIKKIFEEERQLFAQEMSIAEQYADERIQQIILNAKNESRNIYNALQELDPKTQRVRGQLEGISRMFSMNIDFDSEWLKFIGTEGIDQFADIGS